MEATKVISIHALLAESDTPRCRQHLRARRFLSTLSLRRATVTAHTWQGGTTDFYPRSPCGERPPPFRRFPSAGDFYPRSPCGERLHEALHRRRFLPISIHALLAESDAYGRINDISRLIFLSTLSLRRATAKNNDKRRSQQISIHALLAESDSSCLVVFTVIMTFLSTLSLRRATRML